MNPNEALKITTPVGRLVGGGSVYEPKTEDFDGNPLVVKDGVNKGKPRVEYTFGVAFPKTPGNTHWAQEKWLEAVWQLGHLAFPDAAQRPDFAWKIKDGDSTVPGKAKAGKPGKRPCDLEGHPGHWVIWFSSGQAPRLWNADSTRELTEPGAIKNGYYVQVAGNVKKNTGASPGMYWNHSHVALSGFGPEISGGMDVKEAGFGNAALPPGASAIPIAAAAPVGAPAVPNVASVPGAPPPPAPLPASVSLPVSVPIAQVFVPSAKVMTPKAGGLTCEQFMAQNPGWTEPLMIEHGYMLAPVAAVPNAPPPVGSVPAPSVPVLAAPAPIPVTPSAAFVQIPGAPAAPVAHVMTPKAGAFTYEQFKQDPQWTDEALRAHGYML